MKKIELATLLALALISCEPEGDDLTTGLIDCEEISLDYETHECGSYTFISNTDAYLWTVNGDTLYQNSDALDFHADTNGTYAVEASFETPGCPNGVTKGFDLLVDCFADSSSSDTTQTVIDCNDVTADYETHKCGSYTLISNVDAYWTVNGEVLHQSASAVDFDPTENGTYIIEAHYENENCPNGVVREFSIIVDCDNLNVVDCDDFWIDYETHNDCAHYTLISNADAYWMVNGEIIHQGSSSLDFDPTENGTYIIEATYESEECPESVIKSFTVEVDCFEEEPNDCEDFWIDYETYECGSYTLISNKSASWMVNGQYYGTVSSQLDFDPTENGTYIIEAHYESENCPDNGIWRGFNIVVDCD